MQERRLRIVYLKDTDIITILNWKHQSDLGTCLSLNGPAILENAKVHHCFYDADRMATAVVLYHDRFDVVPDGDKIPIMIGFEGTRVIQKDDPRVVKAGVGQVVDIPKESLGTPVYFGQEVVESPTAAEVKAAFTPIADIFPVSVEDAAKIMKGKQFLPPSLPYSEETQETYSVDFTVSMIPESKMVDEEESSGDWFRRIMGNG